MSESTGRQTEFDGWKSVVGARISEFRRSVQADVARTSRSEGAIGALGLQWERQVQDIVNEVGRGLMREAFEIADTTAAEVTVSGERWGFRRVYTGTYETTFGGG